MSEQDDTQATPKRRRSRPPSVQNGATQSTTLQRPINDDKEAWLEFWKAKGQEWRREPEIAAEQQVFLAERRRIAPDIEQGIYPFSNIKLSRADVEWLLATHENGRGPVDWNDESQRSRWGLDLRGADLRQVNLNFLPLTRLCGSLTWNEWLIATEEQRTMAIVLMGKADLGNAKLEGANLYGADLKKVALYGADLRVVGLGWAKLNGADLGWASLEGADLREAELKGTLLFGASLEGADLRGAKLEGAKLEGVILSDEKQVGPRIADISWGDTNLAVVKWQQMNMLGDEWEAQQSKDKKEDLDTQISKYQTSVRANRQLAVALQNQGLNENASHFAYQAQKNQRYLLKLQVLREAQQILKIKSIMYSSPKKFSFIRAIILILILISLLPVIYSSFFGEWFTTNFFAFLLIDITTNVIISFILIIIYFFLFSTTFVRITIIFLFLFTIYLSVMYYILLFLTYSQGALVLITLIIIGATFFFILEFIFFSIEFIERVISALRRKRKFSLISDEYIFIMPYPFKESAKEMREFFTLIKPFLSIQTNYGKYVFSLFLDLLAGYGHKPMRSIRAYLLIIIVFASIYYALGREMKLAALNNAQAAIILSITSFHGRGLFPGLSISGNPSSSLPLDHPLTILAAVEAIIGLIVEISFIATFTQRYLGK